MPLFCSSCVCLCIVTAASVSCLNFIYPSKPQKASDDYSNIHWGVCLLKPRGHVVNRTVIPSLVWESSWWLTVGEIESTWVDKIFRTAWKSRLFVRHWCSWQLVRRSEQRVERFWLALPTLSVQMHGKNDAFELPSSVCAACPQQAGVVERKSCGSGPVLASFWISFFVATVGREPSSVALPEVSPTLVHNYIYIIDVSVSVSITTQTITHSASCPHTQPRPSSIILILINFQTPGGPGSWFAWRLVRLWLQLSHKTENF